MKACQKCGKDRILNISGKCSDCCFTQFQEQEKDGYVPRGLNVGGGDYIEFALCLDCGQLQGAFPVGDVDLNG